jgi:hypothetical protein
MPFAVPTFVGKNRTRQKNGYKKGIYKKKILSTGRHRWRELPTSLLKIL